MLSHTAVVREPLFVKGHTDDVDANRIQQDYLIHNNLKKLHHEDLWGGELSIPSKIFCSTKKTIRPQATMSQALGIMKIGASRVMSD